MKLAGSLSPKKEEEETKEDKGMNGFIHEHYMNEFSCARQPSKLQIQ